MGTVDALVMPPPSAGRASPAHYDRPETLSTRGAPMSTTDAPAALYLDHDAYTEQHARSGSPTGPAGIMGRQMAGKEFLDGYLYHARSDTVTAVARTRDRGDILSRICREHPAASQRPRRLVVIPESEFLAACVAPEPPLRVVHHPCPPDARYAWARQGMGAKFALSGVTHTLSSLAATRALCEMITAPFEPFDVLVCTSRAAVSMVQAVTGAYTDHLAERYGGSPRLRVRLELIPLGVNPDRFRPATADERSAGRD